MQERENKTIFSPNPWAAIISYMIILFILSSVITMIIAKIAANIYDLDYFTIIEMFTAVTEEDLAKYSDDYLKANAISQGWGNFFGYLFSFVIVIFYSRDELKLDLFDVKERKKFHAWYIPATAVLAFLISLGVDTLVAMAAPESANQATIEMILANGGLAPMIFATVLFAPVVEELIYRKAIFKICNRNNDRSGLILSYAASIILFTLPHVLTSSMDNIGIWLLQCLPYAISGFLLCFIYHKSKYNIYTSIAAHMLNNILAVIIVFI